MFCCAYQVCKDGHAETVRLDALISQHVVHQHQSAVFQPDLPAGRLL